MKNLFYTLLAVSLIFSSCSKDDDENVTSSSIVGSWNWTEVALITNQGIYLPDGSKSITSSSSDVENPGDDGIEVVQWTFSDNGFLYAYNYSNDNSSVDTLAYVKSDNNLILEDMLYSIIELSSSNLILNGTFESNWTDDDQVMHFTESDQTIKFNRSTFTSDNINSKKLSTNKVPFFKGLVHNKK
jgi:hypothetical protein